MRNLVVSAKLAAFVAVASFHLHVHAEPASLRQFENRRGAEAYVQSLIRAREFLNMLGLTELMANGSLEGQSSEISGEAPLNSEFLMLPEQAGGEISSHSKFALLDTRLRLNPENVGKVLVHSSGSLGVHLPTSRNSEGQQVAIHLIGFSREEVEKALHRYQLEYVSSLTKSTGTRIPASEVVSGPSSDSSKKDIGGGDRDVQEQLWGSFRACGWGLVRGFNQTVLYPVFAVNSAWVAVFGDALGVGKIDAEQFAKDPVQAVFARNKRRYRSPISMSWAEYWEREKRAAGALLEGMSEFKNILAKGYQGYANMNAQEKSTFNCSIASGLGTGALARVASSVSVKTAGVVSELGSAGSTAKMARIVETPAVIAARKRSAAKLAPQSADRPIDYTPPPPVQAPSIKGMEVREIFDDPSAIPVSNKEWLKMHGKFDPSKIIKSPEPPVKPAPAFVGKRYRAVLDVGDGRKVPVNFEVVKPPTATGLTQIRFENPLHRGQLTERTVRWGELEVSPGFKELSP